MIGFLVRRLLLFIPTVIVISIITFLLIQAPPGDYISAYASQLEASGQEASDQLLSALRNRYGLDQPVYVQYFKWIGGILTRGDFGHSMQWNRPVSDLIWGRIGWTFAISFVTILFTWLLAFPIGIYSATHQYSPFDYLFTFIGFFGQGIPDFLLALVLMWIGFSVFQQDVGGLFSEAYRTAPWSLAKFKDLLAHLWIPVAVLSVSGTAGLIRTMRANLLDELRKPYVVTARAKGMKEWQLVLKYPVRVALNPFVSSIAYVLPQLVSGTTIISIVLSLPTTGPIQIRSLMSQDMYLAGSLFLLLSSLTILGTLISDILLAVVDPRIRLN
ncbi:MAG TPA: ABC transporter permease [Caldilineaceae bacterium]|nr:ABC transporter permease [Caldilineaceae bacterium]